MGFVMMLAATTAGTIYMASWQLTTVALLKDHTNDLANHFFSIPLLAAAAA
jgi:hypothetical protein